MTLRQPDPLDFLLEEAEGAARPRAPVVIGRLADVRLLEQLDDPALVDARVAQREVYPHVAMGRLIALPRRLVGPDCDV